VLAHPLQLGVVQLQAVLLALQQAGGLGDSATVASKTGYRASICCSRSAHSCSTRSVFTSCTQERSQVPP
jgi:hypothetical protein